MIYGRIDISEVTWCHLTYINEQRHTTLPLQQHWAIIMHTFHSIYLFLSHDLYRACHYPSPQVHKITHWKLPHTGQIPLSSDSRVTQRIYPYAEQSSSSRLRLFLLSQLSWHDAKRFSPNFPHYLNLWARWNCAPGQEELLGALHITWSMVTS